MSDTLRAPEKLGMLLWFPNKLGLLGIGKVVMSWVRNLTLGKIIVLIGVVVAITCFLILVWQNQFNQPNNYVQIQKPYNPSRNFTIIINAWSTTFGAQSPVELYVTLKPDIFSVTEYELANKTFSQEGSSLGLPEQYIVFFDGTDCTTDPIILTEEHKYKETLTCGIGMTLTEKVYDNGSMLFQYHGHQAFAFPVEGAYGIYLDDSVPKTPIRFTEYKGIKIEPLETTVNAINNKLIIVLTIAGVYLGGVSVYIQYRFRHTR